QIARLRAELERSNMKMAQFQTRLVSVLDELDAQRHSYQRELHKERRAKEKLSNKLDGYLDEVRRAERERDDLRELVSVLLEKVESCHNYSAWPCPRIGLAYPLDPHHQSEIVANNITTSQDSSDAARSAVFNALQRQLIEEKRAHAITREEADAEFARLRAMIARRDAELEACATHDGHRVLLSSRGPQEGSPVRVSRYSDRTNGRTIRLADSGKGFEGILVGSKAASEHEHVLATTMSRNRALEREVDLLRQQVFRLSHSQSDAQALSSVVSQRHYASAGVQTSEPDSRLKPHENLPPSPGLLPSTMPCSPSPYYLTPRHGRPRSLERLSEQRMTPQRDRQSPTAQSHIRALAEDVSQFATELNDFVVERTALKAMLSRENRQVASYRLLANVRHSFAPSSHPREQQALREQLDTIARERTLREHELEAEIASLRQTLLDVQDNVTKITTTHLAEDHTHPIKSLYPRVSPTTTSANTRASHGEGDGLDQLEADQAPNPSNSAGLLLSAHGDDLGERPMELATPLQTTILSLCDENWLLSAVHPASQTLQLETTVNPADVPLPVSPADDLEPVPSPPSSSSPRSSPLPLDLPISQTSTNLLQRMETVAEERIADIEQQIAATQRHLEERQAVLSALSPVQAPDSDARVDSEVHAQPPGC
ncbi:hypothetical protein PYCCODRAFT_1371749, partial [Trametes coccinea BRFM310]